MANISISFKDACLKELISLEMERIGHTISESKSECVIFITDSESEEVPIGVKKILISNDIPTKASDTVLRRPVDLSLLRNCVSTILEESNAIQSAGLQSHNISINKKEKRAIVNGKKIQLTDNELLLLSCLLESDGEPVGRDKINMLLKASGNTPEVYICNLRKKLTSNDGFDPIITVRGKGYKLR